VTTVRSHPIAPLADLATDATRVPLVTGGEARYVNFDYAASAPPLAAVQRAVAEAVPFYASVHRGAGYPSQVSTAAYERARRDVGAFVGAGDGDVVVFTRNTTDALTLLASCVPGTVLHLDLEHHANQLPWRSGRVRPVVARGTVDETLRAVADGLAGRDVALVAVTGASNVTGECPPLAALAELAHAHGARLAVDGAQLVPHRRVDLGTTGIDYLALSGHKLYAPYGAGSLVGRRDWLDTAPPHQPGGGAVREVTLEDVLWASSPARHEGGTPNVLGAIALAAACRAIAELPVGAVEAHETQLLTQLVDGLDALGITPLRVWPDHDDVVGLVTFTVDGFAADVVATYLSAEHGIGVRDGRFCAHPLLTRLGVPTGAVRASVGLGSSSADVDALLAALAQLVSTGPRWSYERVDGGAVPVPDPRPLPEWAGTDGAPSPCAPVRGQAAVATHT
jgi:selenocysteine lyase/cysteine desulfurase